MVFRYAGHKYCAFQMELNYEHRGWAENGEARSLHYVELPIFMHLNFGSDKCKWFFNLGPQIGYCVYDESQLIDRRFDQLQDDPDAEYDAGEFKFMDLEDFMPISFPLTEIDKAFETFFTGEYLKRA